MTCHAYLDPASSSRASRARLPRAHLGRWATAWSVGAAGLRDRSISLMVIYTFVSQVG